MCTPPPPGGRGPAVVVGAGGDSGARPLFIPQCRDRLTLGPDGPRACLTMKPGGGRHPRRHVPVPDALPRPHRPAGPAVRRYPHDARRHHPPVQVHRSPGRTCPRSTGPDSDVWTWHRRMAEQGIWTTMRATPTPCSGGRRPDRWVGLGRLHDRPRTSARHEHHPAHRGLDRTTGIRVKDPADHGIGRPWGGLSTKTHQLIDGAGLPWS